MATASDLELIEIYHSELDAYGQSPRAGLKYLEGWREVGVVPREADVVDADTFDPGEHNLTEVLAYLELANDTQRDAVRALEQDGKKRKTVLDWAPTPD